MSYEEDKSVSEGKRQQAHKTSVTEADHIAADVAHYHRMAQASHTWSVRNGSQNALATRFGITALPGNEAEPA
jgi:hypothetical protein